MSPSPLPSPVAVAGEEDIRDIRGPVAAPSIWPWVLAACAGLIAAAAGYGAWRLWSKRPRSRPLLPHEIALARIAQAIARIEKGDADGFSTEVSAAVRDYIERRFNRRAAHRTTEEFLYDVLNDPSAGLAGYADLLADFLRHCDLAKFARWPLTSAEMGAMAESARKFVVETSQPAEEKQKDKKKKAPAEVAA